MTGTEGGKTAVFGPLRIVEAQDTTHRTGPHVAPCGPLQPKEAATINKPNRSLMEQVFGIGRYRYSKDGQLYFVHGNCRIKVKEHFPADGKPLDTLLEDLIKFSAKQTDDEIRPAC